MENYIWVTLEKEAIHFYPAALLDENLADVRFLGYPHRHLFKLKVWIEVQHNDRDIEFIQFKRRIQKDIQDSDNFDNKSCEMISDDLYNFITSKYPNRTIHIEVSEDGENGSYKTYPTNKSNEAQ